MQSTSPANTRLSIWAHDARTLRNIATIHRLDLCFGSVCHRDRGYAMDAYLDEDRAKELAERLAAEGHRCTLTSAHEEEEPEVSTTNRYVTEVPRGVGIKR